MLTGTSALAADRASGFGATVYDPGFIVAAITAVTGLSAGRGGRSTEVSSASESGCVCVRAALCAAIVRLDAAAAAAAPLVPRALVAHDLPRPVCRADAGHSAATAPPQRSLSASCLPVAETAGWPERAGTATVRSRRPARAVSPSAASEVCVERARLALPPRGRLAGGHMRSTCRCD